MTSLQKNLSILLPDGESPITLRVVQCLSEMKGIKIYLVSTIKDLPIRYSRHVTKFIYCEKNASLTDWFSLIEKVSKQYSIDVIMPVFEIAIGNFINAPLPSLILEKTLIPKTKEVFAKSRDKWLFHKLLTELDIPGPKSLDLGAPELDLTNLPELQFPVVIKPKSALLGGGKGIKKFSAKSDLESYLQSDIRRKEYLVQEYFEGIDLGFNALCKNGEIKAYTIQMGTLFPDDEFKAQIGLRMIDDASILAAAKKLMSGLEWTGVAHIDFLYNPENRDFTILEINPRYWQTLRASTLSGVNFPQLYCKLVTGGEVDAPNYRKISYLEISGLVKTVRRNPSFLFKTRRIWNETPIKYFFKDPLMSAYHLYWSVKNKLLKRKWEDNL